MRSLPFSLMSFSLGNARVAVWSSATLLAHMLVAGEWFVAPDGQDDHPGTRRQPFATLTRARDAIREARQTGQATGATIVHVARGVYPLNEPLVFGPEDTATADAPVVFRGSGPETQIIGGRPVTGWRETPEGVWETDIPIGADGQPAYFESLYVNGRRAARARHPNTGFFKPLAVMQTLFTNENPRIEYARASLVGAPDDLAPLSAMTPEERRYAHLVVHHHWDTTRRIILDFDAAGATLHTQGARWKPWNPWRTDSLYYVENAPGAFDAPGEWLYDGARGRLRYRPKPDERLHRSVFIAPVPGLQTLLAIRGDPGTGRFVSHLTFEHLAFRYTDSPRRADQLDRTFIAPDILGPVDRPGPTQFEPMQAAMRTEAAIMADGAHHVAFRDCEVTHTGEYAIWLRAGCMSNRIERCFMMDLGAGGVRIGDRGGPGASMPGATGVVTTVNAHSTSFNVLHNCIIRRGGRFHASATAVWIGHSGDNQVTHNEISDHFYTGISVGWVWGYAGSVAQRNLIAFNRIHTLGQGALGDMGGVYTLGTSFGTRVLNNVIFNVASYTYGGWGLYTDEGSEGILFENNLVYDTTDGSFHQHYGRDNIVRNNILAFSRECQIAFTRVEPHRSAVIEGNIIFWANAPLFHPTRFRNTDKAQADWRRNLFWRTDGPVDFNGLDFAAWQAMGRDVDGKVADPLFRNPARRDFRLRRASPAEAIGFQPFDPSRAGVVGDRAWRRRARQED